MARARRRSGRLNNNVTETPEGAVEDEATTSTPEDPSSHGPPARKADDTCPACVDKVADQESKPTEPESWVRCDACKVWFHWRCAGNPEMDLDTIDKWYCQPCMGQDAKRVITMRPPTRKSTRKRVTRDYTGMNSGNESDPHKYMKMLQGKHIKPHNFKSMKGSDLTVEWLEHDESAMREPVLIESPEGLGMKMPPKEFQVRDVAEALGPETPVEVIDVASQSNSPGWTLGKWNEYYETEPSARDKIRNVISLEVSGTELADKILPPRFVRELDWVEKFWPTNKKGKGHLYPKVQLYCLMGVQDAWTDWHIDFAGSSVYYHILHGAKVFYFIRPTPANLAAYEKWSGTEIQTHAWLGDMVDEVFKIDLSTGNTMIIPTGWIHAVYTPVDTLVFGGNFLHSYNAATQLRVREIEVATHVPKKFRFPYFVKLCWYVGEKYLRDLKAKEEFSSRVLESVEALADFLVDQVRKMEKGTEATKREAKEQIPHDKVKDAAAVARELRWRVRQAAGYASDDEGPSRRRGKAAESVNGTGNKRKREEVGYSEESTPLFLNYRPQPWDKVTRKEEAETSTEKVKRIDGCENWEDAWSECKEEEGEDEATVVRQRTVVVKVRRTEKGLERHKIERVVETWAWEGLSKPAADPDTAMSEVNSQDAAAG
ncbi:JmjC domain-containing histone demethylation protein 1 [Abortiporus biennis]|nr:JmjC domain-containing histone demethylation protein 1 [Abortiporus biennis]